MIRRVPGRRPRGGPVRRRFSGPAPGSRREHPIHGFLRVAVRRGRAQRLHGEVRRERTRTAGARTRSAREFPRELFEQRGDPDGGAIGREATDRVPGSAPGGVAEGAPRRRRPRDGDGPRHSRTPRAAFHHHPSNLGRRLLRRRERAPIQTRENRRQRVVGKSFQRRTRRHRRRRRRVRQPRGDSIRHRRDALEREGRTSAERFPRARRAGRSPPRRVERGVERVELLPGPTHRGGGGGKIRFPRARRRRSDARVGSGTSLVVASRRGGWIVREWTRQSRAAGKRRAGRRGSRRGCAGSGKPRQRLPTGPAR